MALRGGRADKTAIALEQPHRGTAATPLATAILNRRHGQGAVPSCLHFCGHTGRTLEVGALVESAWTDLLTATQGDPGTLNSEAL